MHDVIKVIHVSNWMYLFFVISALASLAIFAMVVRRIFKRTTNFKFNVISYLLFMFITSAAVQSYTMITQFDIYPQHVKFVDIDFSSLESSTMNKVLDHWSRQHTIYVFFYARRELESCVVKLFPETG